jgi:serine protease Do
MVSSEYRIRRSVGLVALLLAVSAGAVVGALATQKPGRRVPVFVAPGVASAAGKVSFESGFEPVVRQVLPAVVNVSSSHIVRVRNSPLSSDPFFRQFFGRQPEGPTKRREEALGSGVIVSPDGYILTNNHVIEKATDIKVVLGDRREFKARLVGTDSKTDIAVLKVDATGLPVIPLGDSSRAKAGNFVLAVGNPFGLKQTVTMGIVSATGRGGLGIEDYEDFIQTDAPINPGNSGGALVDVNGDLIGINTAILSGSGGNQGVGFAVPVNLARQVMDEILKHGKVIRGYIGIQIQELTPEIAKALGLNVTNGALVADVTPDSPATRAGIRRGDVIAALNGKPVDNRQLQLDVSMMQPGREVRLTVLRDGRQSEVPVTLAELPSKAESQSAAGSSMGSLQGLSVQTLTPDIAQQLKLPVGTRGAVVSQVGDASPAAAAGIRRGDVILEINRKPVADAAEFERAARAADNQPALLLVDRGGVTTYVMVEPQ